VRNFRPHLPIFFVKPETLLTDSVVLQPLEVGDIECLGETRAIRELSALLDLCSNMPKIRFHFYDPLDFKYGEWLRCAPSVSSSSPLDPMLAVRLSDGGESVGSVAQAWISMLRLADELCRVSSLHEQEGASHWCNLIEFANRTFFGLPEHEISWADVGVPKALLGSQWPVTSRESEILCARKKNPLLCA